LRPGGKRDSGIGFEEAHGGKQNLWHDQALSRRGGRTTRRESFLHPGRSLQRCGHRARLPCLGPIRHFLLAERRNERRGLSAIFFSWEGCARGERSLVRTQRA